MNRYAKTLPFARSGLALLLATALGGRALAGAPADEAALAINPDSSALEWGPCPEFFGEGCHIAVLHGDPAQPNADVLFRLAGHRAFPAHRHTSAERMVLVSGVLEVTYAGQQPSRMAAGDYAFGPAGRVHHGQCLSEQPCVLFIAFEQPIDAIQVAEQ